MLSYSEDLIILYTAMLYIAGVCNIAYALLFFLRACKKKYRPFPAFRRSLVGSSVAMLVFGLPYFLHAYFSIRLLFPIVASVIGLTSFHVGALLFAYAYIELLSPESLTWRRKVFNILITVASVVMYWLTALRVFFSVLVDESPDNEVLHGWPDIPLWIYLPFFVHASYLAFRTYKIYIEMRKADPVTTAKTLRPFIESLPKSVHLIVMCGIGSIVLYCIFPDGIMLYLVLMFVAYFAFYYIYRALTRYGKSLLEEKNKRDNTSKWHRRLVSYNFVYHSVLLLAALGVFYIFTGKAEPKQASAEPKYPHLNLTKHAYWDNPNFDDNEMEELFAFLYTNMDNKYFLKLLELNSDSITYEKAKVLHGEIQDMPDSPYKGVVKLMAEEVVFSIMPKELITEKTVYDYLSSIYNIAQNEVHVSQQAFFSCWRNAMTCYADIDAIDSVKNEANRLLTICRQQNLPYGTIEAYSALGYCLEKVNDYEGASNNLEIAIEAYDKLYTEKDGKDWRNMDTKVMDLLYNYYFMVSKNARYHLEYSDTVWLKQHIEELEDIEKNIQSENNAPILRNLYYTLAIYHDKWEDRREYGKYVELFQNLVEKVGDNDIYGKQAEKELYYTVLVRHALRNHQPENAMKYIDCLPDYFHDYRMSYYPDALLQLGRYEEAAAWYKQTIDHYYQQLNGRNRTILASMSSGLGEESHQMQMMQAQLRNQQTRLMYNTLLTFIFAVMIGGLGYFIYGQYRLNQKLSAAIEAEERAKHVREIFLKNLTHEFHTPLNALYGFSQILADPEMPLDDESTREMASEMVKSSEHITRLLDHAIEVTDKLSKLDRLEDVESIIKDQQEYAEEAPYDL